jgi:steroid Delta-isomerase
MGDDLSASAARHIETFNAAVESGDFAPLAALFADDATLEFAGVSVGPFVGRQAIAEAYAAQPPTDTMTVHDVRLADDGTVVEAFSWTADAGTRARSGEMRLVARDGLIHRLVVAFD